MASYCLLLIFLVSITGFAQGESPIRVGIIDSGISSSASITHLAGYNYLSETKETEDDIGHGTALAGIVAVIAPAAEIIPLKIIGQSALTTAKVTAAAIADAVDVYDCDILLMAFGQPDTIELRKAIEHAAAEGVIMISAVGNDGYLSYRRNRIYYPAGYDGVIAVGSTDAAGKIAYFSQRNKSVFVTTNGIGLETVKTDGTKRFVSGTSFSAACIAGLAAREQIRDPDDFKEYLKTNASDQGSQGFDHSYGWGWLKIENQAEEADK